MKRILCFFGFHKFGNWKHIGMVGRYEEKLKRRCVNCGELNYYIGSVDVCKDTREITPHVFKK